ncbi:MAG TPA: ribosome maturation factor RimM [Nitrospirales bacterium]|jgi:16S rRNA processing protein RimM
MGNSEGPKQDARMVTIGKIIGTHGVGGEVKVTSYSDVPGRFEALTQVEVQNSLGSRTLEVSGYRRTARGFLLRFESIATPEVARSLVGGFLMIPEERLAPPAADRYYEYQLLGMNVRDEDGAHVGILKEILATTGNAVFVVENGRGAEHLIPGTKELVRSVDVDGQIMVVRRAPGLLDEHDAL